MTRAPFAEYNNRMKDFNSTLREIRIMRGYTQKDMSKVLEVSQNCYASWEQGRTEPDIGKIKRLCEIFDMSSDELLGINDIPEESLGAAPNERMFAVAESKRKRKF